MTKNIKKIKRERRHAHVVKKLKKGIIDTLRIVVTKSNRNVFVSLVDDIKLKVITGCVKSKKEAGSAGMEIAEKARKLGVEKIVFDRAGYKYHGVIKAVAEGARKGGLKF
ncbi:MAG: 50S ribosomal protein L18 [Candidatus Omnitrophica bacterium]|nr:50S ribosomal protein L18 [Candidatus Omnitrophota bacterium]